MHVSGIHSTGSSLVSVLLTLLAAVPCSMWCPQRGPCIQKKHLVIFSNHAPPASCVFIPTYFIFFLSWQILLCSYRIWSLYLIILFAVFWISYFFFTLFVGNKTRTAHSFLKRGTDHFRKAHISGPNLDNDPLLCTMLMRAFPPSLFLCPNLYWWKLLKFALLPRYLSLREERELLGYWHSMGILMTAIM